MDSMDELIEAINEADRDAEAPKIKRVRRELESIYREHNREKLGAIDEILRKYKGKEEGLLKAVRKKYSAKEKGRLDNDRQWSFALKNYLYRDLTVSSNDSRNSIQRHNWKVDESLNVVRNVLDELAESIGGTCVFDIPKDGKRRLIVRKAKAGKHMSVTTQRVEQTVEKMRDIVHARYRNNDQAFSNDEKKHSRKKKGHPKRQIRYK
jgi:predicted Rdx family selenoprotein